MIARRRRLKAREWPRREGCQTISCLDFRVLGPLEARIDGAAAQLGTPKCRKLFALLVLNANHVVSSRRAAEELWGERPPESADSNLRSYASSVRAMLPERERLVARPAGYLLQAGDDEVDLARFSALADEGHRALEDHDPGQAVQVLGQALALWRGEPIEDVPAGPVLAPILATLSEWRLTVIERHAAARLAVGQAGQVIPELRDLLARHPCRERGWALLMIAQYRLGDIAGALEGFIAARSALRDRLGVEPGDELQRLQHAILNRTLEIPGGGQLVRLRPASPLAGSVPRQLPARPAFMTARDDQLKVITGALASPGRDGRSRVVIVHGAPGSGKSALAITAAHQVAADFPDGQLYIDLQDFPHDHGADHAAGSLLHGLADDTFAAGSDGAAARLRSALADRSILLVLDNVVDPALVRPLIPAGPESAVLITGCQPMGTVGAAIRVATEELSVTGATQLMLALAGGDQPARCDESPGHHRAAFLATKLCGHLPLALCIVAARLASRPDLSLKILARRLRDERTRLDELCFEGLSVRHSLTRCRLQLSGLAAPADDQTASRLFDLLGFLNARRVDVRQAAMLMKQPVSAVTRAAERLADVGLVTAAGSPGRYRVPELTRLFAAEAAASGQAAQHLQRTRAPAL